MTCGKCPLALHAFIMGHHFITCPYVLVPPQKPENLCSWYAAAKIFNRLEELEAKEKNHE